MKEELQNKLKERFPELFRLMGNEEKESNMPIEFFGIECGDGWYDLIYAISYNITEYCKFKNAPIPEIHQIKEKFGGIRYYLGAMSENVYKHIHKITLDGEVDSFKLCEDCGSHENVTRQTQNWIKTRCDKCN